MAAAEVSRVEAAVHNFVPVNSQLLVHNALGRLTFNSTCRVYMTDDKGKVCPAQDLDWATGCCLKGEQHHCAM